MKSTAIQKTIMRRVYYSYFVSILSHPMFARGFVLAVAVGLLGHWLHVASIIHNFLSIPVGSVPHYLLSAVVGAISHGEVLMVLTLILAGLITVSSGLKLLNTLFFHDRYHVLNI